MRLIEDIIRKNLLLMEQDKISSLSQNITIEYDIFKTQHASIRQSRHGSDNLISNFDIVSLVDDALPIISKNIVRHNIRNERDFIVSREGGDNLNLVIIPKNNDGHWNLIIKTLMMKPEFLIGRNQLKIVVPSV